MSADLLRRAAALTRMAADKCCQCTDGHHRWTFIYGTEGDVRMSRDAALAVADLLDHEADAYEQHRASNTTRDLRVASALATARALLDEGGDQ